MLQLLQWKKKVIDYGLKEVVDNLSKLDLRGVADYNNEQLPYDDVSMTMSPCDHYHNYSYCVDLQADLIAKRMLQAGDEEFYLKTMSTINAKQSFWKHVGRYGWNPEISSQFSERLHDLSCQISQSCDLPPQQTLLSNRVPFT